jgi:hypothetical protein
MLRARKGELRLILAPARLPKPSPRRLRKFLCHDSESFCPARVAKLADARDLKHDSSLLSGMGHFCKRLQKEAVVRGRLQGEYKLF